MEYTNRHDHYSSLDPVSKGLIWLTGAEPEILKKIPKGELRLFAMMGASLLIPATVASMTLPYFFQEFKILDGNALPFGLVCFLVILTLERLLIRGMGHHPVAGLQRATMKNGLGMFLRILLAIVMGALISIPLEHKVFEQDIKEYLAKNQMESMQILEQERDSKRNKIYDHYNPILQKLDEEYSDLNDRYLRELDGSGGTELRGNGSIAHAKKAVCDSIAAKQKVIAGELNTAIQKVESGYAQKLKHLEASFSSGIIARHEALWQLTNDKWSVLLIVILLKLFFLLLDVTPMIAKYMNHTKYYDTHELIMEQAFKNVLATEIELETNRINAQLCVQREIQDQFQTESMNEAQQYQEIQFVKEKTKLRKQEFQAISDGQHQIAHEIVGVICAAKRHCDSQPPAGVNSTTAVGVICAAKRHCDDVLPLGAVE